MKTFKVEKIDYPYRDVMLFAEDNPPAWLNAKENRWFFDDHVLKLEVGASVSTDFSKITRTS